MKDLMGQAIHDYYHNNNPEDLQTETSISELDEMPVAYLFREFEEMNILEQKALDLSKGKVLDIGAGAGSHSLYLQDKKGLAVTALDISPKSIEICKSRGVRQAVCGNMLQFPEEEFDTIILLMNGTGIFQSLQVIDIYLKKLYALLAKNGQILIDSTDIIYMFDEDEDGGVYIPAEGYYGELDYIVHYKGQSEDPIKWLYLDFNTLKNAAEHNGFRIEKVLQQDDSYLARLTKK
ncbi:MULTISPECIES: class I SAM-dependent methyltransferase [Chryseobacterium]|uniref:Ubiquinone/menaquinone biosynthesis C-methylase UbiE n=1 Tax=Chryseobacterium camelliae TaxID=1265445 RepID=A0ABU0TF47_9FLAO|nr:MULTISPECIES: class I SAM-dependent methyltransferase [Chryseobacterium]MDT3406521.1 ubiquinone/menaquinone biosynthesis C-methylase UbiE [Pseudacidovorax intermedius]MDQ1095681.1 ubiquinone/menaquinone biosynthesis C-methylase UbiE [Chryseobacterium camelliae]MDQ1099617.1 ubiquinone/menaquinone biosynthesis C-methylase UbiE [Chryseobacterium sp. SORGH_AS_1048]MDR6086965.1 ubiquinone/menaquinone biosynthesis C-methylase UbiE [Chryseobacterium sp. SORGH_AS_0909]MDR6131337.1 ubiquinone/menaqu